MPLGLGHQLLSYDSAWLYQPYLAFLAALLALTLYTVLEGTIPSRPARAGAAFLAAQPAILYGYALWGGIKELAGALLLALIAALLPWTLAPKRGPRAVLPLAAACATLVCVLSLPGAVWLVAPLLAGGVFLLLRHPTRSLLVRAGWFAAALAVLAIPAFVAAVDWLPKIGAFDKETNLGNLIGPLSGWQLFGIWPVGDFRVDPHDLTPVYVLIAVVIAAGVGGLWWAWRRRAWALLVYVTTAVVGCLIFVGISSPWVGGKTLAMASPAVLAAALAGAGALLTSRRVVEAGVLALVIAGGVLWSNVDQYHDVWLAPRGQLHELETIGHEFAGDGPALMTNYEPYGVRHFLRGLDPEGASELRRRFDYLVDGTTLDKGASADIDRIRDDQVQVYRTLVLRRGPAASRPPSDYRLAWSGRWYEVWQRPVHPASDDRRARAARRREPSRGGAVLRAREGATRLAPGRADPAEGDRPRRTAPPGNAAPAGERAGRRHLHRLAGRRLVRERLDLDRRPQGRLAARGAELARPLHRPRLDAADGRHPPHRRQLRAGRLAPGQRRHALCLRAGGAEHGRRARARDPCRARPRRQALRASARLGRSAPLEELGAPGLARGAEDRVGAGDRAGLQLFDPAG